MLNSKALATKAARPLSKVMPVLEQEHQLMTLADERHWPFRVLGVAPVLEQPVFIRNWWLVPIEQDHSLIPARALERVQAIYEAGIRPKAFVIAHEAPAQLAPPPDAPRISHWEYVARRWAGHSLTVLKVTGTVVGILGPIVVMVLGTGALVTLGLASMVLMVDPCLYAITDDNVWIEIDSWMA